MIEKGADNRFHANNHTMKLLKYVILQYWKRHLQAPQHRIFCCSKTDVYCKAFRMKAQELERHSGSQQGKFSGFLRHHFYAASCVPMQSEGRKTRVNFFLLPSSSLKTIPGCVSKLIAKKLCDGGENQVSGKGQYSGKEFECWFKLQCSTSAAIKKNGRAGAAGDMQSEPVCNEHAPLGPQY